MPTAKRIDATPPNSLEEVLGKIPTNRYLTLAELIALRRAIPPVTEGSNATLSERFLMPPFSVLDARQGYWQKRKRMWLEIGIKSELGRGLTAAMTNASDSAMGLAGGFSERHGRANATVTGSPMPATTLRNGRTQRGDGRGQPLPKKETEKRFAKAYNIGMQGNKENDWLIEDNQGSGTSIFDPVICELVYRWFTPVGGSILDPFAGGSVRGIVAARLGRSYSGVDLRQEQADANYTQGNELCPGASLNWAVGDSRDIPDLLPGEYDFVFSCPPYADLERYSDDPRDLSTMEYPKFLEAYKNVITASCSMLRDNRFACFVVGDIRNRENGLYRGFVGDTIEAFRAAGLELYNEAVLVTAVGSLPIRVGKQFAGSRKLGKTHQNILVFVKGDPVKASEACGEVDVDNMEMPELIPQSVAIATQDAVGTLAERYIPSGEDVDVEVAILELPLPVACAVLDIVRAQSVILKRELPRLWVATENGWSRHTQNADLLSYVIGDEIYLRREVFPNAPLPKGAPLPPQRMD